MSSNSAKTVGSNPAGPPAAPANAGVPEPVVARALVGVGQHGVRLGGLLELLLGGLVAGIAIGMMLERQLAVGALDLLIAGRTADAEHVVVVALAHDAFATFTMDGRRSRSPSR